MPLATMGAINLTLLAACIGMAFCVIAFKPASKKLIIMAGITLFLMITVTILAIMMELQMATPAVAANLQPWVGP